MIEIAEDIKNSKTYELYLRSTLSTRNGSLQNRVNHAKSKATQTRFGKKTPKKKIIKGYQQTDEYKLAVNNILKSDTRYNDLLAHTDSLTDDEIKFFINNKDLLDEMVEAGKTSLTPGAVDSYKKKKKEIEKKKKAEEMLRAVFEHFDIESMEELAEDAHEEMSEQIIDIYTEIFTDRELSVARYSRYAWNNTEYVDLDEDNYNEFLESFYFDNGFDLFCDYVADLPSMPMVDIILDKIDNFFNEAGYSGKDKEIFYNAFNEEIVDYCCSHDDYLYDTDISGYFTPERIESLIRQNPYHKEMWDRIDEKERKESELQEALLDHIPDKYIDLYPLARKLHRKFYLHIGPTNSGKTYSAVEELIKGKHGIYLGPLRLLAFEQFEKINAKGVKCSLLTGEEEISIDGATIQASTIEVLNLAKHYDVAVIDEAQMLTDEFRGGAWTTAILGINADNIHICAAPDAENILINLIKECGDEYIVIRHEGMSELKEDKEGFSFPDSVKKGDALIVFSRKSVHNIASVLQNNKTKCSVIYGALPYDVRHEEARRFMEGETDVLVATDAIGMGLNLPIKRVVILEQTKFDGKERRMLKAGEIQQIIGRAGRSGIYDVGYYNMLPNNGMSKDKFFKLASAKLPDIKEARLSFPETLIGIDSNLSDILTQWNNLSTNEGFIKASVENEIKLSKMLEGDTDDKTLIYDFITIPFDEGNEELLYRWYGFAREYIRIGEADIIVHHFNGDIKTSDELKDAEQTYSALDLEYQLCRRFGEEKTIKEILDAKTELSKKIINFLSTQKLKGKKCSICGKSLPWDYQYGRCHNCHKKMTRNRYQSYAYDDDDVLDWTKI